MDKELIRNQVLKIRRSIDPNLKKQLDEELYKKVLAYVKDYKRIGIYVSLKDEVDTINIINSLLKDKEVYVPCINGDSLSFHRIYSMDDLKVINPKFKVLEPIKINPIDLNILDINIVPLVAYDDDLNRIGYGKGYYDHILNQTKLNVGLAYPFQHVKRIDCEKHDIRLDDIIV